MVAAMAGALGVFSGCSTSTYTVQVDAISQPAPATTAETAPPPQC